MKKFEDEFENGKKSAIAYIAERRNQQAILEEVRSLGDDELEEKYMDFFNWSDEEVPDTIRWIDNFIFTLSDALEITKSSAAEKLRELYKNSSTHTLTELLRAVPFAESALYSLIEQDDAEYHGALVSQIKTFCPVIDYYTLKGVLEKAKEGGGARTLANACIAYGRICRRGILLFRRIATPTQKRLYKKYHTC